VIIIFAIGEFSVFAEISGSIRGASCRGKRFARKQVYPVHAVLAGCLLLGCRAEAIKSGSDPDFLKASLRQVRNELCLRQSTGDSTGPQIDVPAGVLGEFQDKLVYPDISATVLTFAGVIICALNLALLWPANLDRLTPLALASPLSSLLHFVWHKSPHTRTIAIIRI